MNPLGAIVTTVLGVLIFGASRPLAAAAIILGTCSVTQGQEIDIGFHFTAMRILLAVATLRVVLRGEFKAFSFNPVDKALSLYALAVAVISTLRLGTIEQFVYEAGATYNVLLSYFAFRALIRTSNDVYDILKHLSYLLVPFSMLMMLESRTGRNLFSFMGGVPEYSMIRDGNVRSSGAFRSPITAGAFGATFSLLYISMLLSGKEKMKGALGLVLSLSIVYCAHSSGPVLGLMFGALGLVCWRFRDHTRKIRWAIVIALVVLNFTMKAPIWYLIARVSDIVGGGGYHRALLIDKFFQHWDRWWLAGTANTGDWMPYQLEIGGADLTNQFVSDGVNAGLLGLILSIAVFVRCFQSIGLSLRHSPPTRLPPLTWNLGAILVGSIAILFSVTYFDQMHVAYYFLVAAVSSVDESKTPTRALPFRADLLENVGSHPLQS